MSELSSFRDVIELWPSREAMASDIGARASTVSKWWQRNVIPAEWWSTILATGIASNERVTAGVLTALAAREVSEVRA